MAEVLANSEDPDQTPRSAASALDLHCLPITPLGVYLQLIEHLKIIPAFVSSKCFLSYYVIMD